MQSHMNAIEDGCEGNDTPSATTKVEKKTSHRFFVMRDFPRAADAESDAPLSQLITAEASEERQVYGSKSF